MNSSKKLVFFEHDGAIDDLLSLMLLLTMKEVELIGVNVTPADCYIEPAIESTWKILKLFGKEQIPVGRSRINGVNAFPGEWRARPEVVNALPSLINIQYSLDPYGLPDAVDLIASTLNNCQEPVTILMTGPCSNLVEALKREPQIRKKISGVVWMGGAFRTSGNVQTYQHDASAEWNVFWDPISSKELFEMELPLVCIPLDLTNQVPVDRGFLSELAKYSNRKLADLAGQFWAMTVDTIPSYHYTYFMWDVLATSFLALDEIFVLEEVKAIVSDRPPNEGQTILSSDGFNLKIAAQVDKEAFYRYLFYQFSSF
ncbi:nucleoside hydrolase [Algoriphagus marincola]|uniref:nucleoside hydrolase n=1 Tax=Algoriphagus marincola TaxID=264027 RepID=UPI0003FBAD3F|nr:nucleoside hydrolase [Algoriphagus marincola]